MCFVLPVALIPSVLYHKVMRAAADHTTHGMTDSPTYRSYAEAKRRCSTQNRRNPELYIGRGIEFRFDSFEQFLANIGPRPDLRHTLDRINNDGHYEPGNVRWATRETQSRNRRGVHTATIEGLTRPLIEWSEHFDRDYRTIYYRVIHRKWDTLTALITPTRRPFQQRHRTLVG